MKSSYKKSILYLKKKTQNGNIIQTEKSDKKITRNLDTPASAESPHQPNKARSAPYRSTKVRSYPKIYFQATGS